jgi:hypothetical protein
VTLATGASVGYDYLTGGEWQREAELPGAAEFAYPTSTLKEAERLRSVVDAGTYNPESDRVESTPASWRISICHHLRSGAAVNSMTI